MHHFGCLQQYDLANILSTSPDKPYVILASEVACILHLTMLPEFVTYGALFLLQQFKKKRRHANGRGGRGLFVGAFVIASKVLYDGRDPEQSWKAACKLEVAGRQTMKEKDVSPIDSLYIDPAELKAFQLKVQQDFDEPDVVLAVPKEEEQQNLAAVQAHVPQEDPVSPEPSPIMKGPTQVRPVKW